MIKSMTGFGQASAETDGITICAEISSLNHRHLDINARISSPLNSFESEVRKLVQARLERGRINIWLNCEGTLSEANQLEFNPELARQYLGKAREFAMQEGIEDDLSAKTLVRLAALWTLKSPRPAEMADMWNLAERALNEAVQQLLQMRQTEGAALWEDLAGRLRQIEAITKEIEKCAPDVVTEYRERLKQRINSILPSGIELDEQRLLTETAVFADKADISEELARLDSHIQQFNSLARQESNVGRRLDFLLQEMFREISTIGSKARDTQISHRVVEVKGLLEKMREQVQNVE